MGNIARSVLAIASGLAAAILCTRAVAIIASLTLDSTSAPSVATGAQLASIILVPVAAGLALGALAPRWPVFLAVVLVATSLVGTYVALGTAGMPRGLKLGAYVGQTALIALVASWANRRRQQHAAFVEQAT